MSRVLKDRVEQLLAFAEMALRQGENGEALAHAEETLRLDPHCHEALFAAGVALLRMDQPGVAMPLFQKAVELHERPETWNNIGCCLRDYHAPDAYMAFKKSHAIEPANPSTLGNLSCAAGNLGNNEESIAWADKAIKAGHAADVVDQTALYNSALSLIALGRWEEGWKRFAVSLGNRFREPRNYHASRPTPRWDPIRQPELKAVVYGEQGIGDEILFVSMLDRLKDRAGATIVECDPRNAGLFARSFPWATVYGTRGRHYVDWPHDEKPMARLEMGALGEFFAPEPFRRGAYLVADPVKRAMVRAWMAETLPKDALKVGIAWTGGSWPTGRKDRSIHPDQLAPIFRAPGVAFVSLEYEDKPAPEGVYALPAFTRKGVDYDETAALVAELDLIISVTTSVVDLAGALGKPCWALVNYAPQWRYSPKAGDRTMWFYESVTCYRQKEPGQWSAPIAKVARELRELTGSRKEAA